MTREENWENGENPSRIYRVPLCGDRFVAMKEKRKTALIIHRRRATADAFSTLYSFKRNDRVTLLLAAIQPENIGLAAALLSVLSLDLTQKQAPCRARFTPESATDPL